MKTLWLTLAVKEADILVVASTDGARPSDGFFFEGGLALATEFTRRVRAAAESESAMQSETLHLARVLYDGVFGGESGVLLNRLLENGGTVLLRLVLSAGLKDVPWEALPAPGGKSEFLGTCRRVFPVRHVDGGEGAPRRTRVVTGGIKMLAVATAGNEYRLRNLQESVRRRQSEGSVLWMDPIAGTSAEELQDALRHHRKLGILHLIAHGALRGPAAELHLGKDRWLSCEELARALEEKELDLIHVESCSMGAAAPFGSGGEWLAGISAAAVVAHLWPVSARVAAMFSSRFYELLLVGNGTDPPESVMACARAGRERILLDMERSAEAFSPVVFLPGGTNRNDPPVDLFDFANRTLTPQARPISSSEAPPVVLRRMLSERFCLLLGDAAEIRSEAVREKLLETLGDMVPRDGPLSALSQRFAFEKGSAALEDYLQQEYLGPWSVSDEIRFLAACLPKGVHITLLRTPLLEDAVASAQPDTKLFAIQPSPEGVRVDIRPPGGKWTLVTMTSEEAPRELEDAIVIVRPYRGYTSRGTVGTPLITEEHYLRSSIRAHLKEGFSSFILSHLARAPALALNLSLVDWQHRVLLKNLYQFGTLPAESLAITRPGNLDSKLWRNTSELPCVSGVEVIEAPPEHVAAWFEAIASERR